MSLEQRPGRAHRGGHRRRRLPREQPEHPLHDRGDRRLEHRGGARPGRPSPTCTCARTTARRAAAPSCSSRRDRPDPRRLRRADDGLDRRRQRHDDRGAHHRASRRSPTSPGVESGSMNFGDETFITPPPAGRGIIERATDAGHRARGRGLRRRPRGQRGALARGGHPAAAAADQPRLRRARAASTPRRRRSTRCCARCRASTFWTVTCIGRHHQRMLGLALLHGAPGIRTGLEDVAYMRRGVLAPSNAALVEMAVGLAGTLGREVATQDQTRELLQLG